MELTFFENKINSGCEEQTVNIGQSLTDLIKQGTDQINEENIKKGLVAGPNKLKTLFFSGI